MDAATLAPYAAEAGAQAERAIPLVEALVALARPAVTPVDLYEILRPIARLYQAVAEAGEGALQLDPAPNPPVLSSAGGHAARLALATALDLLVEPGARVRIAVRREGGGAVATVAGPRAATLPDERVRNALAAEWIMMETRGSAIVMHFPMPAAQD